MNLFLHPFFFISWLIYLQKQKDFFKNEAICCKKVLDLFHSPFFLISRFSYLQKWNDFFKPEVICCKNVFRSRKYPSKGILALTFNLVTFVITSITLFMKTSVLCKNVYLPFLIFTKTLLSTLKMWSQKSVTSFWLLNAFLQKIVVKRAWSTKSVCPIVLYYHDS